MTTGADILVALGSYLLDNRTAAGDPVTVFPAGVHVPDRDAQGTRPNRQRHTGLGETDRPW